MIEVTSFGPRYREAWNALNRSARNGHFMFDRGFMEYHADRFRDTSLVVLEGDRPVGLFPGNAAGAVFHSHGGLTFGGLILGDKLKTLGTREALGTCLTAMKERGFQKLIYKPVPWIYHKRPAQEDLYALSCFSGSLLQREVSTTIDLRRRGPRRSGRQEGVKKARAAGLVMKQSEDWEAFWSILSANLAEKHDARPTHSLAEIVTLASRFPTNIRLFAAKDSERLLAGVVVFETETVAHSQYISTNERGRATGALDALLEHVIEHYGHSKAFFDFGVSTLRGTNGLNEGLLSQKEGFGGSAVVHEIYEVLL